MSACMGKSITNYLCLFIFVVVVSYSGYEQLLHMVHQQNEKQLLKGIIYFFI